MSEPMHILFALFAGAAAVLLAGLIGRFVAGFVLNDRESKIAGFAYAFSGGGGLMRIDDLYLAITVLVSGLAGLGLLWWLFFKRETQNG